MATCQCKHSSHGKGDGRQKCGRSIHAADGNKCVSCMGGHGSSTSRSTTDPNKGMGGIGGV